MKAYPKLTYVRFTTKPLVKEPCVAVVALGEFKLKWKMDTYDEQSIESSRKDQMHQCTPPEPTDDPDWLGTLDRMDPDRRLRESAWRPRPEPDDVLTDDDGQYVDEWAGCGLAGQYASFSLVKDFPYCCDCEKPGAACKLRRVELRIDYTGQDFPTITLKVSEPSPCGGQEWWTLPLGDAIRPKATETTPPPAVKTDDEVLLDVGMQKVRGFEGAHFDGLGKTQREHTWLISTPCPCPPAAGQARECVLKVIVTYNFFLDESD